MTLLVPFDGSSLAETALERAIRFGTLLNEEVLVVTVLPDSTAYATERDWVEPDEPYSPDEVAAQFEQRVKLLAPEATFEAVRPDEVEGSTTTMDVVRTIREIAKDSEASILFVGSDNVGRISEPLASVGSPIATDQHYDVHIVRHTTKWE